MNEKRTMSYDLIAGILFVAVALHSLMGLKVVNAGFLPTVFYIQNIIVSLLSAASFIVYCLFLCSRKGAMFCRVWVLVFWHLRRL